MKKESGRGRLAESEANRVRCGQGGLFREVERDMEVEVARVREECEARNHPILNPV